jgi:glycine/D-amino acid oxidase-like deaminating enzyme
MTDSSRQALQALANTRFTTYWLDSLDAVDDEAALDRDTSCDLLVAGGGFCGLWSAIQAKEQNPNRDVVLIEARSVANGASGRPAAIMSTSVMHGIDNTERIFPDDVRELERLGQENMDAFKQTIERYQIDCDIEWGGEMKVSIGDQGLDSIDEEHELYLKYGHDAVKLDKAGVQAEIKSPIFHGGTWSRQRSGTVHPGKLVRGLKRAALELGVRLFENTPLLVNRKIPTGVLVETPGAIITAKKVLLAKKGIARDQRLGSRPSPYQPPGGRDPRPHPGHGTAHRGTNGKAGLAKPAGHLRYPHPAQLHAPDRGQSNPVRRTAGLFFRQ